MTLNRESIFIYKINILYTFSDSIYTSTSRSSLFTIELTVTSSRLRTTFSRATSLLIELLNKLFIFKKFSKPGLLLLSFIDNRLVEALFTRKIDLDLAVYINLAFWINLLKD